MRLLYDWSATCTKLQLVLMSMFLRSLPKPTEGADLNLLVRASALVSRSVATLAGPGDGVGTHLVTGAMSVTSPTRAESGRKSDRPTRRMPPRRRRARLRPGGGRDLGGSRRESGRASFTPRMRACERGRGRTVLGPVPNASLCEPSLTSHHSRARCTTDERHETVSSRSRSARRYHPVKTVRGSSLNSHRTVVAIESSRVERQKPAAKTHGKNQISTPSVSEQETDCPYELDNREAAANSDRPTFRLPKQSRAAGHSYEQTPSRR